jgi:hypothetical protein
MSAGKTPISSPRCKSEREMLVRQVRFRADQLISWTEGHASDICQCTFCPILREISGLLP